MQRGVPCDEIDLPSGRGGSRTGPLARPRSTFAGSRTVTWAGIDAVPGLSRRRLPHGRAKGARPTHAPYPTCPKNNRAL